MQFLRRKDHLSLSTFLTNTNLHKWYENIEVGLQYFFFLLLMPTYLMGSVSEGRKLGHQEQSATTGL